MKRVVAVVALTESFAAVWPTLGDDAVAVRVVRRVDDVPGDESLAGVVLGAGGGEHALGGALEWLRGRAVEHVVVVGARVDHRLAMGLVRQGARDYFALPGDLPMLRAWARERAERAAAREGSGHDFSEIIGRSPELLAVLERAAKVIPRAHTTVLITGETGTGKELLARAIHANGRRAPFPFIDVNCSALPASLLEAELFGYERGAFTDARTTKAGLVEAAHGGTLFLDEVGELSPDLQAKLLKVLESKRVRRLGALREREVDVRIIAGTNVNLAEAVREGRFRLDLFFRLNVVPITLPPLRHRRGDILLLVEHFLDEMSARHGLPRPTLSAEDRRAVLAHDWPGNVRELRNAMERAVLLGETDLTAHDPLHPAASAAAGKLSLRFPQPMEALARAAARATVEHFGGNKSAAATALRVSRKRLYSLLRDDAVRTATAGLTAAPRDPGRGSLGAAPASAPRSARGSSAPRA